MKKNKKAPVRENDNICVCVRECSYVNGPTCGCTDRV